MKALISWIVSLMLTLSPVWSNSENNSEYVCAKKPKVKYQSNSNIPTPYKPVACNDSDPEIIKLYPKTKRPSRRFISGTSKEIIYRDYIESFTKSIIEKSTKNPFRQKNINDASTVLDVSLHPNGFINEIIIRKHSEYPEADIYIQSLIQEINMFDRFPYDIQKDVDILHILLKYKIIGNGVIQIN